ncbi:MAG: glycosyltransferase [Actinomycetota bacterium]
MIGEVRASPHRGPRGGRRPSWIVVHTTVGSFRSATHWFEDPGSRVSAHHLVGLDGRVRSFVPEDDAAMHAGRVHEATGALARRAVAEGESPNLTSIGIELVDDGEPFEVIRTNAQYASTARLVARAAERWGIPIDADHVVGHREVTSDKGCPGNVDLDRVRREAADWTAGGPAARPMVVGLMPARNAQRELARWLDLAPGWCDVVVALDDGSTDRTRALLEASSFVGTVLTEPPRPTAAGWHDGRNRTRLLEAAAAWAPDWIVQVDADEWIEPDHADALMRFLATDAVPGLAYGLLHRRAWGGGGIDARVSWVYRVFAWSPGLHMPSEPLHFHPVPLEIERPAWVRTTVALDHAGASDHGMIDARARKYGEADPEGRYPTSFGGLDAEPEQVIARAPRPADLPALVSPERLDELAEAAAGSGDRPLLTLLLPVRNAEQELPGWFDAVAGLADSVIALDDGSTDGTFDIVASHAAVRRVLRHPVRESAAGWDDARNRQELLDAAGELAPRWVMFLDADERIDPDDAAALRSFLASPDADRGAAYGFLVHRMIGPDTYDRAALWVFRTFAWRPGQLLPAERLHLVPVPVAIPSSRWRRTSVRIQHLAGLTDRSRHARLQKYREADPDGAYQGSYEDLLAPPGVPIAWVARPKGLLFLADAPAPEVEAADAFDPGAPVLSAIVIAREDADRIERAVGSVAGQATEVPFETIVVVSGSPATAAVVRTRFPDVALIELPDAVLPGAARNAGLALARGDFVSFPGSHIELPQGSLAARIRAHERGYAMVTGSTFNATRTPSGWAAYFLDHSGSLPGRPTEELEGAPAHCSYEREILLRVGGFPEDLRAGEDTAVNQELARLGYRTLRDAEVQIVHANPCPDVCALVRHHFVRGRGLGQIIVRATPPGDRVIGVQTLRRHLLGYLPRRIGGTRANVHAWGGSELTNLYRRVAPLVWLGAIAAWIGLWFELLRATAYGRDRAR